jgi:lipopolysaccharide transport system ATP-binding protein
MSDFGHAGRTVLFVSHNMSAITRLCHRAILLEGGRIVKDGPSHRVVNSYLNARALTSGSKEWLDPATAPRGRATRLHAVRLRNGAGRVTDGVDIREPIDLEIEYEVLEPGHLLLFALHFFNQEGVHLFSAHDLDPAWRKRPRPAGRYVSRVRVPGNFFSEGRHIVNVGVYRLQPSVTEYELSEVLAFGVLEGNESGLARGDYQGDMGGAIRPAFEWATQFTPAAIELAPATSR